MSATPSQQYAPLIRIIDTLERDILRVLKQTVELWVVSVETQLRHHELDIGLYEWSVSEAEVADCARASIEPSYVLLDFSQCLYNV